MTQNFSMPFGQSITCEVMQETMKTLSGWEDRYRQVIFWGKLLPSLTAEQRDSRWQVHGCESEVWIIAEQRAGHWYFVADSDSRIVKGLIAIVMTAYQGKTAEQIGAFAVPDFFESLGFLHHLSESRTNGLNAMVAHINQIVGSQLPPVG